jgi:hypothetical protein
MLESEYIIELFFISNFLSITLNELPEDEVDDFTVADSGVEFAAGATCPG